MPSPKDDSQLIGTEALYALAAIAAIATIYSIWPKVGLAIAGLIILVALGNLYERGTIKPAGVTL